MSSKYVRDMVDGWVKDPAMTTPFYSTINMEQNPTEDLWFTIEFNGRSKDKLTFCGGTAESGDIELVFFGTPGVGYDTVLSALEADIKTLMSKRDATQQLVLLDSSVPTEFSSGSANISYEMSVYIEYVYFTD